MESSRGAADEYGKRQVNRICFRFNCAACSFFGSAALLCQNTRRRIYPSFAYPSSLIICGICARICVLHCTYAAVQAGLFKKSQNYSHHLVPDQHDSCVFAIYPSFRGRCKPKLCFLSACILLSFYSGWTCID